jgi:predicted  nucleic acid-binding Zn-ribbon protein
MGAGESKRETSLKKTLDIKLAELSETKKKSALAKSQIEELKTNIAESLTKLKECENIVKKTQNTILKEKSQHEVTTETMLKAHASLKETVEKQKKTLDELQAVKAQMDTKITGIENEIKKYQTSFSGYEDQIAGYVMNKKLVLIEISKVEKELGELKVRLEETSTSGSQQMEVLNRRKTQLETQLSALNKELASKGSDTESVSSKIALLEAEAVRLKTYFEEITVKLNSYTSANTTVKAEILKLKKDKSDISVEIKSLENLIKTNTLSQSDKSKAQMMLENQKQTLEKELRDLSQLNSTISSQLKSLTEQSSQNRKDFQEKLAAQQKTNQQIVSNLQSRFDQTTKKIDSVQAQIDNVSVLEKKLKTRIEELTKRSKALSSEKQSVDTKLQDVTDEVSKTNSVINELKVQVNNLIEKLKKYNAGVFKHLPGVKLIGNDVMRSWQGNDINTCFSMCVENPRCMAFTRNGTMCTFKENNASDGVNYGSDIHSYLRHSMDEEVVIKEIDIIQKKVEKCTADLKQIMLSFHVDRPVAFKYDGRNICALKGVVVNGWFVHADGLCHQECPDDKQDRHGNGRCKCGGTNQNIYCPKHSVCVKTTDELGMCVGNNFGVPPPKQADSSVLALPGSARCPDYWYVVKNDDNFRKANGDFDTSFDYFWGRCLPNSKINIPKNKVCNQPATFVNDNWFETRATWAKQCGVKWSAFNVE